MDEHFMMENGMQTFFEFTRGAMSNKSKKSNRTHWMRQNRNPQTHDLSQRMWGNNYEIWEKLDEFNVNLKLVGWCKGINEGDYLLLHEPTQGSTRYRVVEIKYEREPSDMFWATVKFAPRVFYNGKEEESN
jgi:hypothetical protein